MLNNKNKNKLLIKATIAGSLAIGVPQASYAVKTQAEVERDSAIFIKNGKERCAGRILAGMNDCPTSQHACAGLSNEDADPEEYIWLPVGTCAKIAGTHLRSVKSKTGKIEAVPNTVPTNNKKKKSTKKT